MNEVCADEMIFTDFELDILKKILFGTHSLLKHDLKTGILAQMRAFEYIISKFKDNENPEIRDLINTSYETSKLQYELVKNEIDFLGNFCPNKNSR